MGGCQAWTFKPVLLARVHADFLNASLDHCNNTRPPIVPCTSHHRERSSSLCACEWDSHWRRASSCRDCSQALHVGCGEGDSDRGCEHSPGKKESHGSTRIGELVRSACFIHTCVHNQRRVARERKGAKRSRPMATIAHEEVMTLS